MVLWWCWGSVLLILSVYQSKMSKQLNNWKKFLEISLQNSTYSHSKVATLSKVDKPSVGDILRRYKGTQTIERERGGGRKKGLTSDLYITECLQKHLLPFITNTASQLSFGRILQRSTSPRRQWCGTIKMASRLSRKMRILRTALSRA